MLALLLIDLDARLSNGLKLTKNIDNRIMQAVAKKHKDVVHCIIDSYFDDKVLESKIAFVAGGPGIDAGGKAKLLYIIEFIKRTSSKRRK